MNAIADLFAPPGGWRVRIVDLSGGAEEGVVEEIDGFPTLMQANAFARAYVRDSIERCRAPGLAPEDVLDAWQRFGEDAEVLEAGESGWQSATEREAFAVQPASAPERDWRALDPRRLGAEGPDSDDAGA